MGNETLEKEFTPTCAKHGEKIASLERRIERMEHNEREDNKLLVELNTLVKILVDSNENQNHINEQQSKILQEQTVTLTRINDNLDGLNNQIKDVGSRVGKLETKFECVDDKTKIDFMDLIKNIVIKYLFPIGLLAGFMTFLVELITKIKG